jgi:hypothetical protein
MLLNPKYILKNNSLYVEISGSHIAMNVDANRKRAYTSFKVHFHVYHAFFSLTKEDLVFGWTQ